MKKANLRQFRFTAMEAAEALADYINKKDGEKLGVVAGFNINLDAEKGFVIMTVVDMPSPDAKPTGVISFTGGIDGSGGIN